MSSISVTPTVSFPKWAGWVGNRSGISVGIRRRHSLLHLAGCPTFFRSVVPSATRSYPHSGHRRRRGVGWSCDVYVVSSQRRSRRGRRTCARGRSRRFIRAESDWTRYGVWGTSLGPMRGIPYKVYAVEAPAHSGRLVVVWLGFAETGLLLRKVGRASLAPTLHAVFWVVTYAIYWSTV